MKKSFLLASLLVISFLLTLAFVSAAGSSTGSDTTRTPSRTATPTAVNCEAKTTVRERVLCRLTAREASVKTIEESCRTLSPEKRAACNTFQNNARPCYEKKGSEKVVCLRRQVGLGQGQLNRLAPEDRRKYAALLLYELQERVEKKHESGALTDEESANLIASIVDIKEALLANVPIVDVRAKMVAFKREYLSAISAPEQTP